MTNYKDFLRMVETDKIEKNDIQAQKHLRAQQKGFEDFEFIDVSLVQMEDQGIDVLAYDYSGPSGEEMRAIRSDLDDENNKAYWDRFVQDFRNYSSVLAENVTKYYGLALILSDKEEEELLLLVSNGEVVYDAMADEEPLLDLDQVIKNKPYYIFGESILHSYTDGAYILEEDYPELTYQEVLQNPDPSGEKLKITAIVLNYYPGEDGNAYVLLANAGKEEEKYIGFIQFPRERTLQRGDAVFVYGMIDKKSEYEDGGDVVSLMVDAIIELGNVYNQEKD